MDAITINSVTNLFRLQELLQKHDISFTTFLLVLSVEKETLNLTEIADKISMSLASMTTIRDSAESKNFIMQVNQHDRRKRFYTITDLGKELLAGSRQ